MCWCVHFVFPSLFFCYFSSAPSLSLTDENTTILTPPRSATIGLLGLLTPPEINDFPCHYCSSMSIYWFIKHSLSISPAHKLGGELAEDARSRGSSLLAVVVGKRRGGGGPVVRRTLLVPCAPLLAEMEGVAGGHPSGEIGTVRPSCAADIVGWWGSTRCSLWGITVTKQFFPKEKETKKDEDMARSVCKNVYLLPFFIDFNKYLNAF